MTELTAGMVGGFLVERRAHGNRRTGGPLSEVTMGHIWRLLTCILDRAVEEGQMAENPARAFHYGTERQVKAAVPTDREIEAYLDAAGELGYLPIFLLALEQGLRQRELIALKWSNLDVKTRTLTIHEGRVVECGSLVEHSGKMRTINLLRFTVEQLIREHKKHPSSEAMFIHPGTLKPYSPGMIRLLHERVLEQAGLEHIPKLEKKEMKIIPPEQIGAYLQQAKEKGMLPMFYLELTSSLRRGELLALLWTDLDVEKRTITVNKSVSRVNGELVVSEPKTQNSVRTVAIPQQAVDLLVEDRKNHPDSPYLFPSPRTGGMWSPDAIGRTHKALLRAAGIDDGVRFHDLRHPYVKPTTQIFRFALFRFK